MPRHLEYDPAPDRETPIVERTERTGPPWLNTVLVTLAVIVFAVLVYYGVRG